MTKPNSDSNMRASRAKKEWRRPSLRKLPIAATADGKPLLGTTTAIRTSLALPALIVEGAYNCSRCQSWIVLK